MKFNRLLQFYPGIQKKDKKGKKNDGNNNINFIIINMHKIRQCVCTILINS